MIDKVLSTFSVVRAWLKIRRKSIVIVFALIFVCGISYSLLALDLKVGELNAAALGAVICFVPLSILFNTAELQLCAKAANQKLRFKEALGYSTTATIANLLPVPAGMLIRGSALVSSGAKVGQAGAIILVAAIMWLVMAIGISGFFLTDGWTAGTIAATSSVATVIISNWIANRSSIGTSISFVGVRAAMLAILIVRLYFCFLAINAAIAFEEAAIYAVAGIAGTAVTIVPAGLGIAEGFGAMLAEAIGSAPAAAFLALGLNRILGLLGSGVIATFFWLKTDRSSVSLGMSS